MAISKVLITGGAGFLGSHLADALLAAGYRVRALDDLSPQVHGEGRRRPAYLAADVELMIGDVRDPLAVRAALDGVDAVVHYAARVGVGQSMYEPAEYTSVNNHGTAVLLEALVRRPVARLVVASSMSVYGEGYYQDRGGSIVAGSERSLAQLQEGEWELRDAGGAPMEPMPTDEGKPPALASIYALSKFDQERMCLMTGRAYDFPVVALRFFNVYGPRQALSNPYTGVLAIFGARLLNDKPPLLFEDGRQQRDFVSVHDVARAGRLALEVPAGGGGVFNIGSGVSRTVLEVAEQMAAALGKPHLRPEVLGRARAGDIRHCFADITRARRVLGYEPQISFEQGLAELIPWLARERAIDRVEQMHAELSSRGLTL